MWNYFFELNQLATDSCLDTNSKSRNVNVNLQGGEDVREQDESLGSRDLL